MKSKYWLIVFISLPLIIAGLQLYLHVTSDLVSWRGGGFGMYSDPHTNSSRYLWIIGTKDNKPLGIRLSPLDERLIRKECGEDQFYDDSWEFDNIGWDYRNFPSGKDRQPLKQYYIWYLKTYKDKQIIKDIFPIDSLRFVVMQQSIAPDFQHIESVELTNLPF
jgi:hypothetical protein